MKPEPATSLTRKAFLFRLAVWSGWGSFTLSLFQGLRVPVYKPPARHVELGRPESFALGITELPLYQAWLIRSAQGFYALKAVCPHLGCPPAWQPIKRQFVCPCHGSRFDTAGELRQGPALRALERYEIYRTASGQLALNLDKTYRLESGGWNLPQAFLAWPT